MQKLKEKQKKFIGIVPKKSKINNKGITLIALIITIIVMLILVGVTINIALNGGLFEKVRTAAKQTEEQAIYEQIFSAMNIGENGKNLVKETYFTAKSTLEGQGKTVNLVRPSSETDITDSVVVVFKVKGNNGEYIYTITENEIIIGNSTENRFYGYAFENSETGYFRFLNNGIVIWSVEFNTFEGDGTFAFYDRNENTLILEGGEVVLDLNYDCSTVSLSSTVLMRNLNDYFMNEPNIDEEINIYKDAFYSNSMDSEIIYINNDKEVIIGSGHLEGTFNKINISEIEITTQTTFNYNGKTFTIVDNV